MPSLNFKGKALVQNFHLLVPFHELKPVKAKSETAKASLHDNLVVHGDNLQALKSLLPYYHGKVKCIYIDPPYNTGNEGWVYNDNVSSPMMQEWLGRVVDREDLTRHDKWLSMMMPRLKLLRDFLTDDGVIFVSIDDNEVHWLRGLMDEVFGEENFVGSVIWRNVTDNNPTNISTEHEYLHCYARQKEQLPPVWKAIKLPVKEKLIALGIEFKQRFPKLEERRVEYSKWFNANKAYLWPFDRYKFIDDGGIYTGSQSVHNPGKEGYRYDVIHPKTKKPCQEPMMGYRFAPETMDELLKADRILFGEDETKIIELKLYVHEFKSKLPSVIEMDTRLGANELRTIFPEHKRPFNFPKPSDYLQEFLSFVADPDAIVLDAFGGSGTTGQAVLALNNLDGGKRRFVILESQDFADTLTAERIRRVIHGVPKAKDEAVRKGLPGTFTYVEVGAALRLETLLQGKKLPSYEDLAAYVFYTATGEEFDARAIKKKTGFIGESARYDVYLFYEPDLEFLKTTALTLDLARKLPQGSGKRRLVFAPTKYVDAIHLEQEKIDFCQLPFEIYKALKPKKA
jgi:adenine-specific DNA-methyltransferase